MKRALFMAVPALLIASSGCRTEYMQDAVDEFWLELHVEATESAAGQPVGYEALIYSVAGEEFPVEVQLSTELEPELYYSGSRLVPTVAGLHELVASCDWEDEPYDVSVDLTVFAGPPAQLDLHLAEYATPVGLDVSYTLGMWDRYGNVLDTTDVQLEASSADLQVGASALSSDVPGIYELTALHNELSDQESLVVVAGEGASIELTLSDLELELFETTSATVVVRDAYGNETDDPWVLWIEGHDGTDPLAASISYDNVTFMDEGRFTVWATAWTSSGTELEDSVGPLLIDSTGPVLDIWTPTRGDWNWGYTGTVSGQVVDDWSGIDQLLVNEVDVVPESDGSFATDLDYEFGLNLVETQVWDGDGNGTDDLRSLLSGSFLSYGSLMADGIVARVNEGALDTIEVLGEGMVSGLDLTSMIPSPVYSNSSETCIDLGWFGEYCWTWYSVNLYITSPSISGTDLELDPRTGYLDATATIYDPYMVWSASGVVMEIGYSSSGSISANNISVEMDLVPYVSSSTIVVDISNVEADTSGFDFDWDSFLWDIIDFFGIDLDSLIAAYVETAIEDAISDEVPAMLEDVLNDLELATDLELEDNVYALDAVPYSIAVDESGITLSLATQFTASSWVSPYTPEGSLYAGYNIPSYSSTPGMVLSLGEDFVNQLLMGLWGGGLLDMTMTGEEMGLELADLEFIFPDMTELNITTQALLPPVVLPGTGTALLDMQLGDLQLSIYGGPIAEENLMLQAYVHVLAGLDISADADLTMLAEISDVEVLFDVVVPEANTLGAEDTEDLLQALVPLFLPLLTDALGEIPMPEISGFTLSGISIELGGAQDGFVNLGGDLEVTL